MSQNEQKTNNDTLQEAIKAFNAGNKIFARNLLSELVRVDKENAKAWYLLAQLIDDDATRIKYLEEVLRIKPDDMFSKRQRDDLLAHRQLVIEIEFAKTQKAALDARINRLQEELTQLQIRHAELVAQIGDRQVKLTDLDAVIEKAQGQQVELELQIRQQQGTLLQQKKQMETLVSEIVEYAAHKVKLETDISQAQDSLTQFQADQTELETKINQRRLDLNVLNAEIEGAVTQKAEFEMHLNQARAELSQFETEVKDAKTRNVQQKRANLSVLDVAIEIATAQKADWEKRISQMQSELSQLGDSMTRDVHRRRGTLENAIREAEVRRTGWEARINAAQRELRQPSERVSVPIGIVQVQLTELETRISQRKVDLTILNAEIEEATRQKITLEAEINQKRIDLAGLTIEIEKANAQKTELEMRLSRACAELSQLETKVKDAQAQVSELETQISGRCAELSELETQISGRRAELLELDEPIRQKQSKLARLEADIKRKTEQKAALKADIELATADKLGLEAQVSQLENERAQIRDDIEKCAAQKAEIAAQLQREYDELSQVTLIIQSMEPQKTELEAQVVQLQKRQADLERANQEAAQRLEEQTGRLETITQQLTAREQQLAEVTATLALYESDLQVKLQTDKKRPFGWKNEAERLQQENQRLLEKLGQYTADRQQWEDARRRLQAERAQVEEKLQHIERAGETLHNLRLQAGQPLWQAALRATLDAAELPPHIDWVLATLEKTAPEITHAFRVEIAARTAQTVVPKGKVSTDEARLFASVIKARRAAQAGKMPVALEHLCSGWEAILRSDDKSLATPEPTAPPQPASSEPAPAPEDLSASPVVPATEVAPVPVRLVPRNTEVLVSGAWSTLTLKVNDTVIVIDPGGENYVIPAEPPDVVVITHAHADHTQHLPALCRAFPQTLVLMTPETNQLLMLSSSDWRTMHKWVGQELRYNTPFLCAGDRQIVLHPAGHLPGAAMVEIMGDVHILVTGDFTLRPVGGVPPAAPAVFQKPYDLVLMEAVHAFDTAFPTPDLSYDRQKHLVDRLNDAIEAGYTRILILAAALGDAQEVYQALWTACQTPDAPLHQYAVHLKGLARKVAEVYVQAGVWQTPLPDEPKGFPAQSIIICREVEMSGLRQQLEQTQSGMIFEPYKSAESPVSTEQNRRYQVDLHASLEELQSVGQWVACKTWGLYHGTTAGSPLEKTLSVAGKSVVNVSTVEQVRLELR